MKILIVRREVMDDAKRYNPQPTALDSFVANVIIERTLLIKVATNIMIVNAELHLTILD
jgi:hypothetical protein